MRRKSCGCGCGRVFTPRKKNQKYLNQVHKNRAAQHRLRQRAKAYYDLRSDDRSNTP